MENQRRRPWQLSTGAALALLVPFNLLASLAMDIYLPVVPAMPELLGTTPSAIQLTLTLYMVTLGLGQVLCGPVSDRIGRRPVLALGAALFVLASAGLAVAPAAPGFLALRVLQALGASAMLVAIFATIRDVYAGRPEAGPIYGLMNAMLSFVPAFGPILGAVVAGAMGWRWLFWLLAGAGLIAAVVTLPRWAETRPATPARFGLAAAAVLRSARFWAYTAAFGTAMGAFFVFFSTAPRVLIERGGMGEVGFSIAFASVAGVMIVLSRFVAGFVSRWGTEGCTRRGLALMLIGAGLLSLGHLLDQPTIAGFILPMWVIAAGIVLIGAVTAEGALGNFGAFAGTAAALHFCGQSLMTALGGTLAIELLGGHTARPLISYVVVMTLVSGAAVTAAERR